MATEPLTDEAIQRALESLPGWSLHDNQLQREYKFADFKEAMGFIVQVGLHAEAQNHHPEMFNVYSTLRIALNTHDAGGQVTHKDVDLAKAIERSRQSASIPR